MNDYAILTNRKRAIIALIHSVFFLMLAAVGITSPRLLPIGLRLHDAFGAALAMVIIYLDREFHTLATHSSLALFPRALLFCLLLS